MVLLQPVPPQSPAAERFVARFFLAGRPRRGQPVDADYRCRPGRVSAPDGVWLMVGQIRYRRRAVSRDRQRRFKLIDDITKKHAKCGQTANPIWRWGQTKTISGGFDFSACRGGFAGQNQKMCHGTLNRDTKCVMSRIFSHSQFLPIRRRSIP